MEEEKKDWKESWIGWPSKDKSKDTPKPETKDTPKPETEDTPKPETEDTPKPETESVPKKAQDYLKKLKSEEENLGSSIYENFAIFFGITLVIFGFILLLSEYGGFLGIVSIVSGFFTYVSISWFGRVLKGLEQNNNYLKKILKEEKI